ncbi:hypothetical protein ACJX0J_008846, partial [Zea mays]
MTCLRSVVMFLYNFALCHWIKCFNWPMNNNMNLHGWATAAVSKNMLYEKVKPKGVTMTVLLAKAAAMALAQHPVVNASCRDGKSFTYNSNINIAVAVAIDGGLITPVLQDADKLDIYLLSQNWKDLVKKARAKQLQPNEYSSGTFTLSNLGMFGVDRFDAILPPGQGAIMALWLIKMVSLAHLMVKCLYVFHGLMPLVNYDDKITVLYIGGFIVWNNNSCVEQILFEHFFSSVVDLQAINYKLGRGPPQNENIQDSTKITMFRGNSGSCHCSLDSTYSNQAADLFSASWEEQVSPGTQFGDVWISSLPGLDCFLNLYGDQILVT